MLEVIVRFVDIAGIVDQDLNFLSITNYFFQMSDLLRGHFDDIIDSYKVIDCRYPYEFDGGHIQVMNITIIYSPEKCFHIFKQQ
jgi:hypothetical protein